MESGQFNLGASLKFFRLQNNITLENLSERSDLTPSYLSQMENNKVNPSFESIEKYCKGIGITLPELFTYKQNDNEFDLISLFRKFNPEEQEALLKVLKKLESPKKKK